MKILILNGVNLGLLGTREVDIYGHTNFVSYFQELQNRYTQVQLAYCQCDGVGELVQKLHHAVEQKYDGIILNAGAYTHTSIVLADAVRAIPTKVIEVHISNIWGREQYRKNSFLSGVCAGFIAGFGLKSYELAILSFLN